MFRIIHMKGVCSALYTVKFPVGGDIWRGYVSHYIPEGGYVPHYIPEGGYVPHYIPEGDMFRIIYLKGDMFCIISDIYT